MMAVVAVAPRKAGRQLPPWRELEVVQVENLSLRHRALQWLTSTGRQCHPLTSSSDRGRKTYLGRCSYHSHCPKRFRFALLDATRYHQQRNLGTQSHHQFDDGQALRRYGAGLTACLLTEKISGCCVDVAVQSRGQWFHKATPSKIIMKKIESNQRVEQSTEDPSQYKRINSKFNSLKRDPIS